MIQVFFNPSFEAEKRYVIDVLFDHFVGIPYQIELSGQALDVTIRLDGGKSLIIADAFFSRLNESDDYMLLKNLPKSAIDVYDDRLDLKLSALYGDGRIDRSKETIKIHADLIASTFLMLTRWEERVILERDQHDRFPAAASSAGRFGLLDRPIVNEYLEWIWQALVDLGIDQQRKDRQFSFLMTHDVDLPRLWWNGKDFIRSVVGSLVKRRDLKGTLKLLRWWIKGQDPFDTFDLLMSRSESYGLRSHFFFMSGGTSDKDNYYRIDHPKILQLMETIKKRGHQIGFHPSFNAYNDPDQFELELKTLREVAPLPVAFGRHHFLRFEVPTTWQIWEDQGMHWDSSMSYHDSVGFRCGVCYPFPVFNVVSRKKLNLIERPLIVMDGSFVTYGEQDPDKAIAAMNQLIDQVERYRGEFVFLWHNSAFNIGLWGPFEKVYHAALKRVPTNHTS